MHMEVVVRAKIGVGLAVLAVLLSGGAGVADAPAVGRPQPAPDLRCPSALCRSELATLQLSAGYGACMTTAGASLRARRACVRQEQSRQNKALALIERRRDARQFGSGLNDFGFDDRRLFRAARDKVCGAIALVAEGEARALARETCVLHQTAERVVLQRGSMLH